MRAQDEAVWVERRARIEARLDPRWQVEMAEPMLAGTNLRYEMAARVQAIPCGTYPHDRAAQDHSGRAAPSVLVHRRPVFLLRHQGEEALVGLARGLRGQRALPADGLVANWAYLVIASQAWNLKVPGWQSRWGGDTARSCGAWSIGAFCPA